MALSFRDVPQDCSVCRRVPAVRKAWGCDDPAPNPFAYLECPRCQGYDPECARCSGDPRGVPHHDCPFKVVPKEFATIAPLFQDWKAGRLPESGGVLDQAAWYVNAMRFIESRVNAREAKEAESLNAG